MVSSSAHIQKAPGKPPTRAPDRIGDVGELVPPPVNSVPRRGHFSHFTHRRIKATRSCGEDLAATPAASALTSSCSSRGEEKTETERWLRRRCWRCCWRRRCRGRRPAATSSTSTTRPPRSGVGVPASLLPHSRRPHSLPRRDVPSQPNPSLRRTSSSPSSPSPPPSSLPPPLPAAPPPPLALAPPPPLALAPSRPALSVLSRRSAARRRSRSVSPGGAEVAAPASARPRLPALLAAAAAPCRLEERSARPRLPVHGVAMDAGAVPATRMQRYGPNELERHAPPSLWMLGHGGAHKKRTTPPRLDSSPSWSPPPPTSKKLQGNLPRARRIGSEMWESLALTLAGVAGNSIGKVLQKKGTLILPPLSFKLKVIRGCALNMLSQAPVRLPPGHLLRRPHAHHALTGAGLCCAVGCGLATLCIFSNFYLKDSHHNGWSRHHRSLCQRGGAESGRDSLFQYTLAGAHRCHLFCRFCSTFGFISTKSIGANNVGLQSGYISDGGRVWGG